MIQRLYILYIKIIAIYTNNLHDRSSSSKSDNANEQSFPRTIYKLRAVSKLIKSMRLTEALLVLRIDLIGLLPPLSPSFSPVSTLSQIYIYICMYLFHGRYTLSSNVETLEMRKPRSGTPATGELSLLSLLERCAHFFRWSTRSSVDWKPVASLDAQHGVASCRPPLILRDYSFPRCFNDEFRSWVAGTPIH